MPYTHAQIDRIMQKDGKAFVPSDKLPYAGRVCETLVRKKIYALEDYAAARDYAILHAASQDIRQRGQAFADYLHLDAVTVDVPSIQWRRHVLEYAEQSLTTAADRMALAAYADATTAYAGGYYGRLWLLDQVVKGRYTVNKPRLNVAQADTSILQPGYQEAIQPDMRVYRGAGDEWRENYRTVVASGLIKIRRALAKAQSSGYTVRQALDALVYEIGVNEGRGLYYQAQLVTRAAIMRASNHGAVAAYKAQTQPGLREATDGWLLGAIWLTSNDGAVCPVCRSHAGQVWLINDLLGILLLGLPPDGSHYGCRCQMAPFLIPDLMGGTEPPEDTWDEWIEDEGFGDELEWFTEHKTLKSSRV